jgi:glycosyltransferase involved in cell wall biosynthesis
MLRVSIAATFATKGVQGRTVMRVAILSGNARPADAIGNQIAEKTAFFLERGDLVRVLIEDARTLHPAIASHCQAVQADCLSALTHECLAASDLVIAEFGHYHSLLRLLPLCNWLGRRVLVDYHGITPLELWGDLNQEAIAMALRRRGIVWYADAVLVHSDFTKDEIQAATGYPLERTFVLGHPIDTRRFCADGSQGQWRRRLRLTKNETLLLFVGRIARNKRIDILIEALSRLPEQAVLAIAGDGGDVYAQEAARSRKLAEAAGLSSRIHWLGQVNDADLPDLYRAADVFVTASEHEGFCIPVAEALCSGTPVVAARAGALPETVGEGGLLFTPSNANDLAGQLRRLLFDLPVQKPIQRERGIAEASRFARPRWREQFGRLVETILDMPARPVVERLQIDAANETQPVSAKQRQALVALRVSNGGSHPVELSEIHATCLQTRAETGRSRRSAVRVGVASNTDGLVMPGSSAIMPILVGVPGEPGTYALTIQINKESRAEGCQTVAECRIELSVSENPNSLQSPLVELAELCRLPEGYEYEANGRLGRIKAWLKEKLLGGFRRRYVDLMSRQQSAANGLILMAIAELNASVEGLRRTDQIDKDELKSCLEILHRVRQLERRVAELEETNARVMT